MKYDGWAPDLSPLKNAPLYTVSDLALYAVAGATAIRLRGCEGTYRKLSARLASQGLLALQVLAAPQKCTDVLTAISEGRRPSGDTASVADVMHRMAKTLSEELDRRNRDFDRLRGLRCIP